MSGLRTIPIILIAGTALLSGMTGRCSQAEAIPPAAMRAAPIPQPVATPTTPGTYPAPGQPWTLSLALQRAMEANPELLVAKAAVEHQEGVRMQVRAHLLPHLSLIANAQNESEGLIDLSPAEFLVPPSQRTATATESYLGEIEIRQQVFDGLASYNAARQQGLLKERAVMALLDTAYRTAALTRQAYDALLLRQEALLFRQQANNDSERLADIVTKLQRAGDVAAYESLRAQAEAKSTEAELAKAQGDLAEAQQSFRRLLQIKNDEPIRADGHLMARPMPMPLETAIARAKQRADLKAAELLVKADKAGVNAAVGEFFPKVEVYGDLQARSSYYDVNTQLTGWVIGALGRWPLFDGFETQGKVRTARAELTDARIKLDSLQYNIVSELRELYAKLDAADAAITGHRSALELGRTGEKQATRLYEVGQISIGDVLTTTLSRRRSEVLLLESLFAANEAVSQIEYAAGGFIDSPPSTDLRGAAASASTSPLPPANARP